MSKSTPRRAKRALRTNLAQKGFRYPGKTTIIPSCYRNIWIRELK